MTSKGYALARAALIRTLTAYSGITTEDGAFDGTATLIDSNLKGRNDFITEKTILIMSGDAKDEDKGATDFDPADGKITLQGTGFSHQIKAGTVFRILNISSVEADIARIEEKIDSLAGGAFWGSYGPRNVEVDNDVDFGIMLYDPSGNIITIGEITPGTYTVHRIRGAVDTEIVGSTASSEAAGRVYMTHNFPSASWVVGDIFYITFSGIEVTIDATTTKYPDLFIWGRVVREADISSKVDAIEAKLDAGAPKLYAEQIPDTDVDDTATTTESECELLTIGPTADRRYCLRHLRLKAQANPGDNTMTVRLYEYFAGALVEVDSFEIDTANWGTYHSLMDMFGIPEVHSDAIKITCQMDAGTLAVKATYSYAEAKK